MKDFVKKIAPPGYEKPNRRKLYDVVSTLGMITSGDALAVLRNFFPFLADRKALKAHGKALSIPRYSNDTDDDYRVRVATAMLYIRQRGTRGFFRNAFSQRFSGREYRIIEEFLHLTVKVLDMSESDRAWLYEFLEAELDPNILISLVDWFRWVEKLEAREDLAIDLNSFFYDSWNWGVTYSGELRHDHGEDLFFNGVLAYDGGQDLTGDRAKSGTWTGRKSEDLLYSDVMPMDGRNRYCGEFETISDKGNYPAVYGQGEDDELSISLGAVFEDKTVLIVSYASAVPMDGGYCFGENRECFASDELVLNIGGVR